VRRLVYRAAARRDMASIFEYITRESGSIVTGRRFIGVLRQQCAKLAALPGTLGRPRPELRPDIQSFAFRGYVIFSRYEGDAFEIVNVLEGHRDTDLYFGEEDQVP
jgi:toxin ParE1/3/4